MRNSANSTFIVFLILFLIGVVGPIIYGILNPEIIMYMF